MQNDLKFSGTAPVVINYNGNADDVYAPVRTSNCDINIVSPNILDDLYTARKDEICVKIGTLEKNMVQTIVMSSPGSCNTIRQYSMPLSSDMEYTIYQKNLFYKDIDGVTRFNGIIEDANGNRRAVNLKYVIENHGYYSDYYWVENNDWKLDTDQSKRNQYFHDGTHSFKIDWDGSSHHISIWDGSDWINRREYQTNEGNDMNFSVTHIFHSGYGYELLFGMLRYKWDDSIRKWFVATPYTDTDGDEYFATYGEWHLYVKDRNGSFCHAVQVSDLGGEDWICSLDVQNNTFTRMIPIMDSYDLGNIFTHLGNVFCIKNSGELYVWDWTVESWCKWITFTGNAVEGSFYLDYIINTGASSKYYIKYTNSTNNKTEVLAITNITLPTFRIESEWDGTYTETPVWEGYKMPNTYSQDVTQNLDSIEMTCIDPVSLLKYVTIDKLRSKPALVSYRDLIGGALAYVMLDSDKVFVEQSVSYGGFYVGDNGMLDLKCQISNFWDEADEPATLYEVIEEMLRPFCMVLAFSGDAYWIYNQNNTDGYRMFNEYKLDRTGGMTYVTEEGHDIGVYDFGNDWKSNNTQPASIQINETYSKVTGVASTMVPNYSKMAIDLVDYTQRDKYDAGWMNVQRNKTKGYTKRNGVVGKDTADHWFYIWNGVYVNQDYDLEPWSSPVNWYVNINKMYEYLDGQYTEYGADHGSVLNFYGGQNNPTGTGKEQTVEKAVAISKRITAYAADNGFPPELLEFADLDWTGHVSGGELTLQKQNTSNTKFGDGHVMGDSDRIVYHQMYENIYLNSINNPTLNIDIARSFSRTGIDVDIEPLNYNTADNVDYNIWGNFTGCDTNYLPQPWNASQIVVNSIYFRRYSAGSTIRVTPVWDKRRIDMYVELSDSSVLQFNGKEWVAASAPSSTNCFYLLKLMNNEKLFHTDHRYDVIETSDGQHYSLTDKDFTYYTDNNGGVYPDEHGTAHTCSMYKSGLNYWEVNVNSCSAGQLSIILPQIEDPAAVVYVDVYNSSMLGMTGSDDIGGSSTGAPFYYANGGGEYTGPVYINFLPKNLSHVKAEHIDLDITISVPESNLGQMFSESDIRYELDSGKDYIEKYETPSFQVNTYNQLVTSSFSYLIFDNSLADPGEFVINGEAARPECYVVQAYMKWLGRIRKIYSKTIKANDSNLVVNNIMKYISSPEVGEYNLMIVSDSWDLKSDRHSITAVEDNDWEVNNVETQDAVELPRKARAERWNLPTVGKP